MDENKENANQYIWWRWEICNLRVNSLQWFMVIIYFTICCSQGEMQEKGEQVILVQELQAANTASFHL